jgi:uncharacterized iron-regulated protein
MRKWSHFSLILVSFTFLACASAQIYREGRQLSSKSELFQSLRSSQVIFLGENHGFRTHRDQHLEILRELRRQGHSVHVALEFFYYPDQFRVDSYRLGQISEMNFLKDIKWGQPSFDYYREQALFPKLSWGERTWAINAPRQLTSQVARAGLESLSSELQRLLPPQFVLGRDSYRKRFQQVMGGHVSPEAFEKYFAAQSIWDDTMAWKLSQIRQAYPQAVIVVIVGEFHTQYGGGLADRLKARGVSSILTLSQVNTAGMSTEEIREAVIPHPEYGPRADWIWAAPAVE